MNINSIPTNHTQKVQKLETTRSAKPVKFMGDAPDSVKNTQRNAFSNLPLKERLKSAALNGGGAALASTAIGIWLPIPLNIILPLSVGVIVSGVVVLSPGIAVERWGKTFKYQEPKSLQ